MADAARPGGRHYGGPLDGLDRDPGPGPGAVYALATAWADRRYLYARRPGGRLEYTGAYEAGDRHALPEPLRPLAAEPATPLRQTTYCRVVGELGVETVWQTLFPTDERPD